MKSLLDIYQFENKLNKKFNSWHLYHNYTIVKYGKKWGILNRQMEWLVRDYDALRTLPENPPLITYEKGFRFVDLKNKKDETHDFFIAKKNNKWGVIDLNENIVIEFVYGDYLKSITSKQVLAASEKRLVGIPALTDMIFDSPSHFQNGQASVSINKKWGVINNQGEWIIKPTYQEMTIYSKYYLIVIKEKCGLIDAQENIILPPKYDALFQSRFREDYLIAVLNDKWGIIDIHNNVILDFQYDRLEPIYGENNYFSAYLKSKDKWGLIDSAGNIILPFEYDAEISFYNDIAITRKKDEALAMKDGYKYDDRFVFTTYISDLECKKYFKYGAVNLKNEVIIPFEYTYLSFMSDVTLVAEKENGKNIIIDFSNKQICETEFDDISGCSFYIDNDELCSNYYLARKGQKYGFIDKFGEVKIDFKYEDAYYLKNGYAAVSDKNGKCGIIDKNNNLIIPCEYDWLFFGIHEDLICAQKGNKNGAIDWDNNVVIDFIYDSLGTFDEGFSSVKIGEKYGFIDKQGNALKIQNI